jgi:acetyl-CoA C-acetyltransferase
MAMHAVRAGESDIIHLGRGGDGLPLRRQHRRLVAGTRNPRFADAEARTLVAAEEGATGWTGPRSAGAVPDIYIPMGQTAEDLARLKGVSRDETDGVTLEAVAGLRPVFRPDGRITAGNCCPLNDGAAALVVMSDKKARALGITPLARVVATGVSALSPEIMGLGPVAASRQALARAGMSIIDVDLVEINEAFAAQVIPSYRELGVDLDKLNVNGGAIAVGHPFGMTGARITTTLLDSLTWHDKTVGLEPCA